MTFWILVVCILVLIAVAGFVALIFLPYAGAWFLGQKLRGLTDQRDSRGERIAQGPMARMGIGSLTADMALLAQVGGKVAPERGLNQIILRPTRGLRIISVGGAALLLFEMIRSFDYYFADSLLIPACLAGFVIYAVAQTLTYQLRYDTDGFTAQDALFRARRVAWKNVVNLTDNGHYLYYVGLDHGRRVEVPKYLVGIRDFLTYAKDQMRYHDRL